MPSKRLKKEENQYYQQLTEHLSQAITELLVDSPIAAKYLIPPWLLHRLYSCGSLDRIQGLVETLDAFRAQEDEKITRALLEKSLVAWRESAIAEVVKKEENTGRREKPWTIVGAQVRELRRALNRHVHIGK